MWLLLALQVAATQDLSADFDVPDGLEVTLWAESPALYNPTAIDVDERGRIWLTEAVNYRLWNRSNKIDAPHPDGDRVVILEDTDLDGRCDSSRVFAQDPDLVAPLGIAVLGERVFVSCSPSIFVFHDANGDGDALDPGEKKIFLTGFGGHDHDHGVHSIVLGPDGRLYFAVGNAGPHVVTDKSGWTLRSGSIYRGGAAADSDNKPGLVSDDGRVYTGGLILSVLPDGTDLRVEAHNFRNEYEVALDSFGELYTFDNDDEVVCCRASWVMRGGNYGFFSADGSRTWRADQRPGQSIPIAQWHAEDPGVVPTGTITGSGGPTGCVVYQSELLANWFEGQFLAADAGRGEVFAFLPVPDGAGVRLDPRPSVIRARGERDGESAHWFRPSDVCVGVDGTLFVADWYDPGVGGHAMGDVHAYGRILRIAPSEYRPGRAALATADDEVLLEPLASLSDSPARYALTLRDVRFEECSKELLRFARQIDGRDRILLEAFGIAAEGKEEEVFALAAGELGEVPSKWSEGFAAIAWRLHPPSAVPAFLARAMDPALPEAARRQAIDALAFVRTREAAEAMATLALASPEDLRPYARWWLDDRLTNDWRGLIEASAFGGTLADAERVFTSGIVRSGRFPVHVDVRGAKKLWLVASEGEHGNSYDWADWLEPRFEGSDGKTRLADCTWLEERAGWGATHVGKNCDGGPLVVESEMYEDGIGTHARSEIAYAIPEGAESFEAIAAPDDMGSKRTGSTNELAFEVWIEKPPSRERVERLTGLAFSSRIDPAGRIEAMRELALDPEGALALVRAAERGSLDDAQKTAIAEHIFENPDLGVRALASAEFRRPGETRVLPPLAELVARKGSAARGRELFLDPRAQCSTCHTIELGGRRRGGDIGPELTGVGKKLDALAIWDAILNPSASIEFGYDTWQIETKDGELLVGFLIADGPTVVLKDTRGERHAIPADEIAERRKLPLSTMPAGVSAGLSADELVDLVAFLREDHARVPVFGPQVELFDGNDLAGWTYYLSDPKLGLSDVWSVVDGTIVCRGDPAGYIRTQADYTSFELELDWRWNPASAGNSGVLLRMVGEDRVWPESLEAQLMHTNAGDIWNIGEYAIAVDADRTEATHTTRRAPCSEKALGEWNHYRIRLDRSELLLEVNGVVQNTAAWCPEMPGKICLQSEGGEIQFRNVVLRPILD
jgi:putative membrane-bound dehydrogenase-like protein